jgi:phage baseplate assembly protein W
MAQAQEQFGRGIVCPFQRDGKGDFANDSGMNLLKSDIGELLGIEGPSVNDPGELPWDPDRGSRVNSLRHRKLHTEMMRALAEQYTATPIRVYERRVRVGPVRVSPKDERTLRIEVSFAPKSAQMGELETVPLFVEQ